MLQITSALFLIVSHTASISLPQNIIKNNRITNFKSRFDTQKYLLTFGVSILNQQQ